LFTDAELDPVMPRADLERAEPELRNDLLTLQEALRERADRAVLVVVAGIDGAGKGSSINLLNEWMDPRGIRTMAFGAPTDEELRHPPMWRYWRELPARGSVGVVFGSWYTALFMETVRKKPNARRIARLTDDIARFETMLANEGVQLVKLWYHLSRDAQRRRCKELEAHPDTAWRVSDADRKVAKKFKRLRAGAETVVATTDFPFARWKVVPSADDAMRTFVTAATVCDALKGEHLRPVGLALPSLGPAPDRFAGADYTRRMAKDDYEAALAHWQGRLARAVHSRAFASRSLALVFEGSDAAGKGGAIRRLTNALDVRQMRIMAIAAPGPDALARPYLWRFWRDVPTTGRIAIFDRSWYGRVLVERVEGFARPAEWKRAYDEIRDFEDQLTEHGTIVVKCWLAITKEEQLARFRERESVAFKRYKITPDDWRNRGKWAAYRRAANDMFAYTDSDAAPWALIASDDKRFARVEVVKTIALAVEQALGIDAD
jgi:polyphosphate:AMP phosphotransferase